MPLWCLFSKLGKGYTAGQLTAESRKSRIRSTVHPSIYWVICMCSYADGATERTVTTGIWENARLIAYAATARLTSITSIVAAGQEQKIALRGSWTRCEEFSQCRDVLVLEKLFLHPHPTQKKAKHHQLEVSQVFQRKKGWDPLFALEIRTWHPVNPLGSPKAPAAVWKKSGRAPGVDFLPIQVGKMMNQLGKLVVFFSLSTFFSYQKMNHGNQKFMFFLLWGVLWYLWNVSLILLAIFHWNFPEGAVAPKRRRGRQALQKRQKPSLPQRSSRLGWSVDCCGFQCFDDDCI